MRVVHFYKTSFPDTMGGVERVIDQIARGAARSGVEVDVLSLASERDLRSFDLNGYRAHRARLDFQIASTGFSASAFSTFAKLAREADLIHYHFPWPFMDLVHFAVQPGKPAILTYHSDIIRQRRLRRLYVPLERKFLGDMHRIVATSPNYAATSAALQRFRHKVTVIPIGLDKGDYPQPPPERDYWRRRFGPRFFLFVGVIRYYKGLHLLMEAARTTSFPIVIVGTGPLEERLKARAKRLGLHNVHFLGYLPEEQKVALLQSSYAVLLPSHLRSEAFGISLLEGAMYGKPMICSEIGTGTSFINVAGETGLVVPPGDPVALRGAMNHLWEHPDEAAAMGKRAEERYRKMFGAGQMIERYLALYRELVRDFEAARRPALHDGDSALQPLDAANE